MIWKKVIPAVMTVIVVLTVFLTSCEGPEGPQGPAESSPYITGAVSWPWSDSTAYASVEVSESPAIPGVTINGIACKRDNFMSADKFRFLNSDLSILPGDSVYLRVVYTKLDGTPGVAKADIVMPGFFEIAEPDTSFTTIEVGDGFTANWTESSGADVYSVDFSISYNYYDTLGVYKGFRSRFFDSLLVDTTITFEPETLFPNAVEIDSITYGSGSFSVRAMHGFTQEGPIINIYGDGLGYFYASTYGDGLYLYVEQ